MSRRRLLIAGGFFVLVIIAVVVVFLQMKARPSSVETSAVQQQTTPATNPPASGSTPALSKENVDLLQKINSPEEAERLQALAPMLRENEGARAQLGTSGAQVEILPETFRLQDLYATVDARLTGNGSTVTVTYILQPSDGLWRIVTQQKR